MKGFLLATVGAQHWGRFKYRQWLDRNFPDFIEIAKLRKIDQSLKYRPLISVVVPTYSPKPQFLRDCIESVQGQIYENWELCIVDDASPDETTREIIKEYSANDDRISFKFLETNQHIAQATNEAIKMAKGDFVALFDHDDLLWPNALLEVVRALNNNQKLDFIYSDEDKITEDRFVHPGAFFKPDWSPDFLHSVNYITHLSVVRKSLLDKLGGLNGEYNGAQDWDLFLRITSTTKNIYHIPKVLYSWRVHDLSTAKTTKSKPYVIEAQRKAITADLKRRGYENATVEQDPKHQGYWHVEQPIKGNPLISIVIPTKNQYKVVKRCVNSIFKKTTYNNFEIVLVDTGSTDKKVRSWYKKLQQKHTNVRIINWPEQPFSYSRSCNKGAQAAKGELLVMLNNDTEVITPNWLELLAGDAQRPEIGAVGCLLFFPDGRHIQHAGIGVGLGGVAANSFSMMTLMQPMTQTQHLMINTKHNMSAVTAACMMIRTSVFEEVGEFAEEFRVTYNDVDLCLRLREKGYEILYTPYVRLIHHESISVGMPEEIKKRDTSEFREAKELFVTRWANYVQHDPHLNPNLSKDDAFYDVPDIADLSNDSKMSQEDKPAIERRLRRRKLFVNSP
ncbi:MAG TPA: glycosyltransferase family 2 protein [Verrucomicrobiae bacterium]|nr:glycosyltransferase family 2 protein [Verrucomicrobiae bacterium]